MSTGEREAVNMRRRGSSIPAPTNNSILTVQENNMRVEEEENKRERNSVRNARRAARQRARRAKVLDLASGPGLGSLI